jgi:hypothetical protein
MFDLSVQTVALAAATLSLAARRQSGCTVRQKFFAKQLIDDFFLLKGSTLAGSE